MEGHQLQRPICPGVNVTKTFFMLPDVAAKISWSVCSEHIYFGVPERCHHSQHNDIQHKSTQN